MSSWTRAARSAVLALLALLAAEPFLALALAAAFFLSPSFVANAAALLDSRLSGVDASAAASESACADMVLKNLCTAATLPPTRLDGRASYPYAQSRGLYVPVPVPSRIRLY